MHACGFDKRVGDGRSFTSTVDFHAEVIQVAA